VGLDCANYEASENLLDDIMRRLSQDNYRWWMPTTTPGFGASIIHDVVIKGFAFEKEQNIKVFFIRPYVS